MVSLGHSVLRSVFSDVWRNIVQLLSLIHIQLLYSLHSHKLFWTLYINSSDAGNRIFQLWDVNTTSADALAPKVAYASVGMVLAVQDRQHILLFQR